MKNAITAASLGLASCKIGELTLANSLYEKNLAEGIRNERIIEAQHLTSDEDANEEEENTASTVQNGSCIRIKEDMHVWNLKLLEKGGAQQVEVGSEPTDMGVDISGKAHDDDETYSPKIPEFKGRFMYKIC